VPLEKAEQWKAEAPEWMVERIRDVNPPGELSGCLADEGWAGVYQFFAANNYVTENLDFLAKVQAFQSNGSMDLAKQIYEQHGKAGSPQEVNLSSTNRSALAEIFDDEDEPIGPPNLYDAAYAEIYSMTNNDSYKRFVGICGTVQTELAAEIDWDNVEGR